MREGTLSLLCARVAYPSSRWWKGKSLAGTGQEGGDTCMWQDPSGEQKRRQPSEGGRVREDTVGVEVLCSCFGMSIYSQNCPRKY